MAQSVLLVLCQGSVLAKPHYPSHSRSQKARRRPHPADSELAGYLSSCRGLPCFLLPDTALQGGEAGLWLIVSGFGWGIRRGQFLATAQGELE